MNKTELLKQAILKNRGSKFKRNTLDLEAVSKELNIDKDELITLCDEMVLEGILVKSFVAKCHVCGAILKIMKKRQTCFINSCFNCKESDVDVPDDELEEEYVII